jgi:hypothetical protein
MFYRPSFYIDIDAMDKLLNNFMKRLRNETMVSTIITFVDPTIIFSTGKLI